MKTMVVVRNKANVLVMAGKVEKNQNVNEKLFDMLLSKSFTLIPGDTVSVEEWSDNTNA